MNNKIPEYEIKYSKIKNIYIQIKNGKITVKAPKRVSKKEIEKNKEKVINVCLYRMQKYVNRNYKGVQEHDRDETQMNSYKKLD